jgi:hypothetical protein
VLKDGALAAMLPLPGIRIKTETPSMDCALEARVHHRTDWR